MKVLAVRGHNITSLERFELDFTARAFSQGGGLFLITGPTGSGKSTLLDCICLALYGATPRYDNNKHTHQIGSPEDTKRLRASDPRNLLRHGAGSGYAEVDFLGVDEKIYRARWIVRRARNKASGNLLPPEWQIFELDTAREVINELSSKGVTESKSTLLEKVGLTLKQFSRSVFLAQGEFDAFLKAEGKERGELLEKMTGTEIYRQLSARAFAKCKEVRLRVDELDMRRAQLKLLKPSDEAELKRQLSQSAEDFQRSEQQLDALNQQLQAIEVYGDRERTLSSLELKVEHYEKTLTTQAESLVTAERRVSLAPLIPSLLFLEECDDNERRGEETLAPTQEKATKAQVEVEELEAEAQSCRLRLEELSQRWFDGEQERSALTRVEEEVTLREAQRAEGAQRASRQSQVCRATEERLKQAEGELERLSEEQAHRRRELETLEGVTLPDPQGGEWRQVCLQISSVVDRITTTGVALDNLNAQRARIEAKAEPLEAKVIALTETLNAEESSIDEGGEEEALHAEQLEVAQRELTTIGFLTEKATELWSEWSVTLKRLEQVEGEEATLEQELSSLDDELKGLQKGELLAELKHEEAQRAWDEHQALHTLAPFRAQLTEGEPCPLCGALEHPHKAPRDASEELSQLKRELALRAEELGRQRARMSEYDRARLQLVERQRNARLKTREVGALVMRDIERSRHAIESLQSAPRGALESCLSERTEGVMTLVQSVTSLRALPEQERWAELERPLEELKGQQREASAQLEAERARSERLHARYLEKMKKLQELKHELQLAQASLDTSAQERKELEEERDRQRLSCDQLHQEIDELCAPIEPYAQSLIERPGTLKGLGTQPRLTREALDVAEWLCDEDRAARSCPSAQSVRALGELWELLIDERARLERSERSLVEQLTHANKALHEHTRDAEQERKELDKVNAHLESCIAEHERALDQKAKSATRRSDMERLHHDYQSQKELLSTLLERLQLAQTSREEARAELEQVKLQLKELKTKASEAQRVWEEQSKRLKSTREEVLALSDELLQDAHLTVRRYQETAQQRDLSVQQLEGFRDELEVLRASLPPAFTERREGFSVGLRQAKAEAQHQRDELFAQRADIQRQLQEHDAQKIAQQSFEAEYARVTKEHTRWAIVNELIGSQKGDKFRDFAQSLTLEMILDHSNVFLRDLAPRYQLTRVADENLAFQIIDQDFGDELRSINSLSGGESFLVSLALALGLSSTSAQDVQIQSLFIDEDFGTLDPSSLDMALSVLENLQVEGRQIGIISHVEGLAERVGLEVRVAPQGGGRSVVHVQELD